MNRTKKPEVMSPAGYWPQLRAAVEAGADAVYFGLKHFTARAKVGFEPSELPEVMRTLHRRGVRGFVTFNTLVFEHELNEAARAVEEIARAGADALIIQDLGIAKLAREIAPDIEIHASTQMSITDTAGVAFARSLGVDRVTLARELSLAEIRAIASQIECELEVFVHGALCVSYSGQCFSSEAWGGRSANRGQCAQACRLPYELVVDGRVEPLADARYLLSPGDLYALEQVPELVDIGVSALKIEGRYKDAAYVALTTAAYRKAVDQAWAGRAVALEPIEKLRLEQVYSRGLGPHFMSGTNHQKVVEGRAPRHRGLLMGRVTRVGNDSVTIASVGEAASIAPLKPGDGVVFDAADWRSPQEREEGGRIFERTARRDGEIELRFGNGAIRLDRVRAGDLIWRTDDPDVDRAVRPITEATAPVHRQRVSVKVVAREGQSLRTEWRLDRHPSVCVTVESAQPLGVAQNRALTVELLREQFARLGNTAYELSEIDLDRSGSPFAPASLLNPLRREAVERLQEAQTRSNVGAVRAADAIAEKALRNVASKAPLLGRSELHLLVRTPGQLAAAMELIPASITLDYLDLYGLRPSAERLRASAIELRVATPRVLKPGEEKILNFLLSLDCALLVRGSGMVEQLAATAHRMLIGDFSLNTANSLTAQVLSESGFARLTPSHDLNAAQISELAGRIGPGRLEVVAYQHLPVFHTEHCVFCRFLSTGTSYRDCGRPCETHEVGLRDEQGRVHPVIADVGCRNTVFGAEAQDASLYLDVWREAGIRHYRLEFAHESDAEVRHVAGAWKEALAGRITSTELRARLKAATSEGTTEGSLFVPEGWAHLPVLQ